MYYDETASHRPAPPTPKPQPDPTKLCINCKHLAKSSLAGCESWKCFAEQNIIAREIDLVTGATIVKRHFLTCYDARKLVEDTKHYETCGPEGKWFEERPVPPPTPTDYALQATHGRKQSAATDLLSQLDKMP